MKVFILFLVFGTLIIACRPAYETKTNKQHFDTGAAQVEESFDRFFSDASFWNQPLPEHPEIDPRSDEWIAMLEQEPSGNNFGINCTKWTVPVYYADRSTPLYHIDYHYLTDSEKTVWNTVNPNERFGHGPHFNPVPIPDHALPDPEADAHFCVIDRERRLAWDMWGLHRRADGTWESNTGMVYRLDGSGTFDGFELGYVDGESCHFHGPGRAAGVPVIAGLIMYDEVMQGEIRHKLSCATRYSALQEFCYPASWTDGFTKGGIPEGAVIQLDPNLDLEPFGLTPEETIVAHALQRYGMVVVDVAGGQPVYAEGLWARKGISWEGKLREWDGGINSIPYSHYRIIKVEKPVYKGDLRSRNLVY